MPKHQRLNYFMLRIFFKFISVHGNSIFQNREIKNPGSDHQLYIVRISVHPENKKGTN